MAVQCKTLQCHCRDTGSIPGQGNKIPMLYRPCPPQKENFGRPALPGHPWTDLLPPTVSSSPFSLRTHERRISVGLPTQLGVGRGGVGPRGDMGGGFSHPQAAVLRFGVRTEVRRVCPHCQVGWRQPPWARRPSHLCGHSGFQHQGSPWSSCKGAGNRRGATLGASGPAQTVLGPGGLWWSSASGKFI